MRQLHVRSCVLAIALLATTGCYKATFIAPGAVPGPEHDEWTSFFIFGLVGSEHIDARKFCSGPIAKVATGGNVGTVLVGALTIGIYTPRKVYVTCAAAPGVPRAARQIEIEVASGTPVEVMVREDGREWKGTPVRGAQQNQWKVAWREEVAR